MFANEAFLNQLIANQQRAIRYYLAFAIGLILLGVTVMVGSALASSRLMADVFKGLFSLGGAFVSSLSAFQIKEVLNRKEKIQTFEALKMQLNLAAKTPKSDKPEDRQKIDELIWKVVEKTALS